MIPLGDVHYFETTNADGTSSQLFLSGDWGVGARGNYGSPPIEYLTQPHYQGHGERVLTYRVVPRTIGLTIYRKEAGTRDEYWENRETLLDVMRPNYPSPTKLVIVRTDGSQRAIDIRPDPGAPFEPNESPNFDIQQVVSVTAHNPFWYDPTDPGVTLSVAADDDLVFPITFPIELGAAGTVYSTGDLSYAGTWLTYPRITITGAYNQAVIRNTATDVEIRLVVPLGSGDTRIIELDPDKSDTVTGIGRNVTDASGVEKWHELSEGSNLIDFCIRPNSEINGTQKINVSLSSTDANSDVSLSFYTRYYGI